LFYSVDLLTVLIYNVHNAYTSVPDTCWQKNDLNHYDYMIIIGMYPLVLKLNSYWHTDIMCLWGFQSV